MLSILNHYQRIRKHNEELVLKLVSQNEAMVYLLKGNEKFASQLPFPIGFIFSGDANFTSFLKKRKSFDEIFIREAINQKEKSLIKELTNSYIEEEELFFKNNNI